jgi:glutathione-regulated potassium-efflux system ancillary protein KefG
MKTLVVVAHPDLAASCVNRAWALALQSLPDLTVHDITAAYPDMVMDVAREQELLRRHDGIVLQFPMYWYSCPAVLKAWLDQVMQPGFAFGRGGSQIAGKCWLVASSIGGSRENYRQWFGDEFDMAEMLRPLERTIAYLQGVWCPPHLFFGAATSSPEALQASATSLRARVQAFAAQERQRLRRELAIAQAAEPSASSSP